NVMLVKRKDRDELVKVLDFGIAKLNEAEGRKHITGITDFVGTPAYMSPEQARGESLDSRSDLYSVGAMLFELVSGRGVFTGPTPMSIVSKHMTEPPPRFTEAAPGKLISPAFETAVRKALEKKRESRYADANAMRLSLEKVRRDLGALVPDLTPVPEEFSGKMASRADFDSFERSLRVRRALTPFLVLALLGGGGYAGYRFFEQAQSGATHAYESEPNDLPSQATRIAFGTEVRGTIGASKGDRSDRDLYVLEVPQGALGISISGVDDLNLSLEVSEAQVADEGGSKLKRQLFVDDLGVGAPEQVDGFTARSGEVYLRIEEGPHYSEPRRGPREKANLEYRLLVRPLAAPGHLEVEPNDTLALATECGLGKPVTGYTGAPVPYPPPRSQGLSTFSAVDFLLASPAAPVGAVSAIVVAPAGGKLQVIDAATYETWDVKAAVAAKDPGLKPLPHKPGTVVGAEPELVSLGESSKGYGLRVQPSSEGAPPPGSVYQVAFITDGPTGLAGAIALASNLGDSGRAAERTAVLKLAATAFPDSPQVADVRSLLEQSEPARATP
ncbi:MAG: serine/threonine protein kinase, partial [Myxococcaceae bacterium]